MNIRRNEAEQTRAAKYTNYVTCGKGRNEGIIIESIAALTLVLLHVHAERNTSRDSLVAVIFT